MTLQRTFNENDDRGIIRGTPDNNDRRQRKLVLRTRPDGRLWVYSPLTLVDQFNREIVGLGEADGTLRNQLVLWETTTPGQIRWRAEATGEAAASLYGTNVSGNVTAIENEDTGELRVVNLGWDGAAPIRVLCEATGEQRTVPLGADEANNLDRFRTDPNRVPWKRDYPAYVTPATAPSVEIPAVEGILWNPGGAATVLYEVSFNVINNDAGAAVVTVSVGRDVGGGGALATPEYWMFNEVIPYPGESSWRGPYLMTADDDVRGVASAANDASIHFRIKRVDLGA